ncbi:MAG TPA: Rieske 2Fe-2S domain-containing protein [Thermoanaerobaculia bacterium]|nr:Rieske 2Fe-2S domain-containing protein [Thermoanaerobaculia bacterium]
MGSQTVANLIDSQEWLDETSGTIADAIRDVLPRELKNLLHGTWLGHPLHPVLTDIPVGAWSVALALDGVAGMTGSEDVGDAADVAIAIGLLGAVGAAVTGATDWSETYGRGRKVGLVHGILNLAAAGLYTGSLIARRGGNRDTGVALSMLGYAIAGASAYLGGHLVFSEQIGVDHTATADADKPEEFTAVMAAASLAENKPTRVVADGVAIMLLKRGERIYALTDTCPHLGGPLSEGTLVDGAIRCPWHGSELALEDGSVVNGPSTFPARCFQVRIQDGVIELRAGNKQAAE